MDSYLEENPQIVTLFEIDIIKMVDAYTKPSMAEEDRCEPDMDAVMELWRAQEAFDREMEVSQ